MRLRPAKSNLLLHLVSEQSNSPIVRPETHTPDTIYGVVVDRGPDCKLHPIGTKVLFYPANATMVPHEGVQNFLVSEDCIFATYEDDNMINYTHN